MRRMSVPRPISLVSLACGLAASALGAAVMIAWFAGQEAWVRIHPTYMPMQFNTALSFFCTGAALALLRWPMVWLSRAAAAAVFAIAAVTGAQFLFDVNLGIDELFLKHYAQERASYPGRMAPNSAIAFLLTSSAVLLLSLRFGRVTTYLVLLLASIAAAMGVAALFGYATAMASAYSWGERTPMAVHTAVGFAVIGAGVVWAAWIRIAEAPANERFGFGVHIAIFAAGATIVTGGTVWAETYQGFSRAMFEERSRHLEVNAEVVAHIVARKLTALHDTATSLAANASVARGEYFAGGPADSHVRLEEYLAAAIDVNPAYKAVRVFTGERAGAEVAHVNRDSGQVRAAAVDELIRDGRHERVVRGAMTMRPGQVHVAVMRRTGDPSDLNIDLRVATPVYIDGAARGVIALFADADLLLADVLDMVAADERFYLANEDGEYAIHPAAQGVAMPDASEIPSIQEEFPAVKDLYEGKEGATVIERYDALGRIYSAHRLGSGPYDDYVAALATDAQSIHDVAVATRNRSFAAGGGLLLIAVVCVMAASRSLTRPLRQIEKAALALGRGEAAVTLPDFGVRETGALATAFTQMRARIQDRTEALEDEVERRKETEDTLRTSEERYRSLVWASSQIVVSMDADKRIVEPQGSFERYTGLEWDAYAGDRWLEAIHGEDRGVLRAAWNAAKPNVRAFEHEARLWNAATDSYRYISFRAVPLSTAEGAPTGWIGAMNDCHEQKLAVERFRLVVESSANGQVMANGAGEIVYVNGETERMFGYDRTELCGQPIEILLPERYRAHHVQVRNAYQLAPDMRAMGQGRDLAGRRKDGSEFPVEVGLSPIQMADGVYILATIVDVTERKAAQQALEQYAQRLEALNNNLKVRNRELDEFTYVASHDLQEPLRKLTTFSGLLRDDLKTELPPEAEEDLRVITNAARRMQTLVQDLLALSRSGRSAMKLRPIDLAECVRDAADSLQMAFGEKSAELRMNGLPTVHGDYTLLTQLFQNLMGNGLKFNDAPDPWIEITAEERDGTLVIGVKDNGIGIDPAYREQIFSPFKRLHGRQTYEGTGIGLAVCRKIVERHGGAIWVEGAEPRGSHFLFTLNVRSEESDHATN